MAPPITAPFGRQPGNAGKCLGGRIAVPHHSGQFVAMSGDTQVLPDCPICGRVIPQDVPQSRHHLIPKLKGGKGTATILVHQICHNEIHATFSEAELARSYYTVEAIRSHPRIAKFVAWVSKRPPEFRSRTPGKRRGFKR